MKALCKLFRLPLFAVAVFFTVVGHSATQSTNLLSNGDFTQADAGGEPTGWDHRTKNGGVTLQKEGDLAFVRIAVPANAAGADNFIQEIIKLPDDARKLTLTAKCRFQGVLPGDKKYQHGFIQGRFMKGVAEIGGYIDMAGAITGDHADWQELSNSAAIGDGADSILLRAGFYGVKGGQLDVALAGITPVSAAMVAAELAKNCPPQPYGDAVSDTRFAHLAKGASITVWFEAPYNGQLSGVKGSFTREYFRGLITDQDVALIKSAGLTDVRLPIEPVVFMDAATGKLDPKLLPEVDFAIARFVKAGIAVQVDAHPHLPALRGMAATPEIADKFALWWGEFAAHLSQTTDPEYVFLELQNEPGSEGYYGADWSAYQDRLIMAVRSAAPKHTIIANGGGYMLWDRDTLPYLPHPDRNIIYALHYYEPGQFTAQGALWMKPMYVPLRNVPWPCDESNLQPAVDSIIRENWTGRLADCDKTAEPFLRSMVTQGLGLPKRLHENFDKVGDWARKNGVRVIVNEFGVYAKYAPPADRFRWLTDVRQTIEAHGFGWSVWDYGSDYAIVTGAPGARQLDPAAAAALGLKVTAKP